MPVRKLLGSVHCTGVKCLAGARPNGGLEGAVFGLGHSDRAIGVQLLGGKCLSGA